MGLERQRDGTNLQFGEGQQARDTRRQRLVLHRLLLVAAVKRYVGASRLQSKARGMPSFSKSTSPGTSSVRTWYGSKKAR